MTAIRRISSPDVPDAPPGLWSNCLMVDSIAYVSGTTARGRDPKNVTVEAKDEYQQARLIFTKIRALLEAAGGSMADVVKVVIYVVNIARREEVWRARREFFSGDFPTSTLVEVRALASPEILVEIDAIAHIGASRR